LTTPRKRISGVPTVTGIAALVSPGGEFILPPPFSGR
jgi:hypothetical protein